MMIMEKYRLLKYLQIIIIKKGDKIYGDMAV